MVLKKFQMLCQKSPVENRYPELMYKRYCQHIPGYLVQRHLCFVEGVSLPFGARKEFLAERNLLRFHNIYWAPSILLRSKHYGIILLVKGSNNQFQMLNKNLTKFNIHFPAFLSKFIKYSLIQKWLLYAVNKIQDRIVIIQ